MKHLFLIHSHTTFLTSMGVIEYERLNKEDIVFGFSRNYKTCLPHGFRTYDISEMTEESFYMALSYSRRHFFYDKKKRDEVVGFFDEFVEKEICDDYNLYCCQLQAFTCQILATNPHCKECFFIQEGGRTMYPLLTSKIAWYNRLYNKIVLRGETRFWKMGNWFPNDKTPYNRPITAYALDYSYFCDAPKETRIVKWPQVDLPIRINTEWPIFTLEGAVELGQVKKRVYVAAVEDEIRKYSKENNYIKFHPKQSDETKQMYLELFKKLDKNVEVLPQDVPFELIVSSFKDLTCIGFGTSLLFYAKTFGHKVISEEDVLIEKSLRYRLYSKSLAKLND